MLIPTYSFTLNFSDKVRSCKALNMSNFMYNMYTIPPPEPPREVLNMSVLEMNYGQRLKGMTFKATYMGRLPIPGTSTYKDVLSITQADDSFFKTLDEMSDDVLKISKPYGQQVWKAFTCPKDTPNQADYRLFVEPDDSIPGQSNFKVDEYKAELGTSFFSIKVSAISPA